MLIRAGGLFLFVALLQPTEGLRDFAFLTTTRRLLGYFRDPPPWQDAILDAVRQYETIAALPIETTTAEPMPYQNRQSQRLTVI